MKVPLPYGRLLHFCGLLALLSGCGQKDPDPVPPTGIAGTVTVRNQLGTGLPKGGVTVTVFPTSPLLTAKTNEAGAFALGSVPAGTYTLVFSRPGLSTFVLRGVAHPQSNGLTRLPETYALLQEPELRATSLRATNSPAGAGGLPFVTFATGRTSPQPTSNGSYVLYFSTTPDVSFLTATSAIILVSSASSATTTHSSTWSLDRAELARYGFTPASGTTGYAVAYGMQGMTPYTDLATGQKVHWPHPNLTPSPVVSFTMP
ncbi:carboxypeptidase-like regulatory domain-containing protein [Hymenobacter qilianensis]|uniref:Carboxypeptidase regulatory-like domain-containing protein n=1 Tax=Hymenobacter qilianensis TaxID=1385715 RepID=A0A7H0H171_9BACT|nr:carboxypeptidase-like regulatory domain-containing protein [Hymenobacter qilianensis]QNP54287.1 carboxypeptidase regulatory-like domain-containing protein [Hymenobacter qilianensis]